MKKLNLTLSVSLLFVLFSSFVIVEKDKSKVEKKMSARLEKVINRYQPALVALNYDMDAFIKMTPSKYKQLTGKRLGIMESIELRQIQKGLKKSMNPEQLPHDYLNDLSRELMLPRQLVNHHHINRI